jgi:hypothetical protein
VSLKVRTLQNWAPKVDKPVQAVLTIVKFPSGENSGLLPQGGVQGTYKFNYYITSFSSIDGYTSFMAADKGVELKSGDSKYYLSDCIF